MLVQAVVSSMAGKVKLDDCGRITLPERVRDRYGDRVRVVELDDGVKLGPIPPWELIGSSGSSCSNRASSVSAFLSRFVPGFDQWRLSLFHGAFGW
jgi:DNA-binding transcriptional regulator/RsmH inhibitor MraZ